MFSLWHKAVIDGIDSCKHCLMLSATN